MIGRIAVGLVMNQFEIVVVVVVVMRLNFPIEIVKNWIVVVVVGKNCCQIDFGYDVDSGCNTYWQSGDRMTDSYCKNSLGDLSKQALNSVDNTLVVAPELVVLESAQEFGGWDQPAGIDRVNQQRMGIERAA